MSSGKPGRFAPIPAEQDQWVEIEAATTTWEHASWLSADDVEDVLREDLRRKYVYAEDLDGQTESERIKRLLEVKEPFVPVINYSGRLRELYDHKILLDCLATQLVKM